MPSSVGLWAGAYAEGVLGHGRGARGALAGGGPVAARSAAGYGVPLPLRREAAARALGFAALDRNVATVQGGRGKLEAAALFWCTQLGHELARLSQDVILFSAEEYGYLVLPRGAGHRVEHHAAQAQSRPVRADPRPRRRARGRPRDACSRSRASSPAATSATFSSLRSRSCAGSSAPEAMLAIVAHAVPKLGVDRARCAAALAGGALATDEVMRRVEEGSRFAPPIATWRPSSRRASGSGAVARRAHRPAALHRRPRQPRARPGLGPASGAAAAGSPRAPALRPRHAKLAGRPTARPAGAAAS